MNKFKPQNLPPEIAAKLMAAGQFDAVRMNAEQQARVMEMQAQRQTEMLIQQFIWGVTKDLFVRWTAEDASEEEVQMRADQAKKQALALAEQMGLVTLNFGEGGSER